MMKQLPILIVLAYIVVGCSTTSVVSKDPVVDAEKATVIAEATFNTLFTIEKENHDLIVKYAPAVHIAVDGLRKRAVPLLQSARAVTLAYKTSSTPENRAALVAILTTVKSATEEAIAYKTQVLSTKGP